MTDRVFIRHPDQPHRNGYVSQAAFDALWSKKGFVIDEPDAVSEPSVDPDTPGVPPVAPVRDEKTELTARLEAAGIQVDRRWGIKRLRVEVANLGDRTCSVCDAAAVYEIEGAPEEKGNLACEEHRGMWPLAEARPLAEATE